jgi:hypothetical protein
MDCPRQRRLAHSDRPSQEQNRLRAFGRGTYHGLLEFPFFHNYGPFDLCDRLRLLCHPQTLRTGSLMFQTYEEDCREITGFCMLHRN